MHAHTRVCACSRPLLCARPPAAAARHLQEDGCRVKGLARVHVCAARAVDLVGARKHAQRKVLAVQPVGRLVGLHGRLVALALPKRGLDEAGNLLGRRRQLQALGAGAQGAEGGAWRQQHALLMELLLAQLLLPACRARQLQHACTRAAAAVCASWCCAAPSSARTAGSSTPCAAPRPGSPRLAAARASSAQACMHTCACCANSRCPHKRHCRLLRGARTCRIGSSSFFCSSRSVVSAMAAAAWLAEAGWRRHAGVLARWLA